MVIWTWQSDRTKTRWMRHFKQRCRGKRVTEQTTRTLFVYIIASCTRNMPNMLAIRGKIKTYLLYIITMYYVLSRTLRLTLYFCSSDLLSVNYQLSSWTKKMTGLLSSNLTRFMLLHCGVLPSETARKRRHGRNASCRICSLIAPRIWKMPPKSPWRFGGGCFQAYTAIPRC